MNFTDIIKKYDSPTTFFYVDPPYWKTENYYTLHNFDADDHKTLSVILKNIKGRFALSYYEFELLTEWFPKDKYIWETKGFKKIGSTTTIKSVGTELLIMNYQKNSKPIDHNFWNY